MLLAGYVVWRNRGFLEHIHPLVYGLVLLLVMVGVLRLTAGNLLRELREHGEWRRMQNEKQQRR